MHFITLYSLKIQYSLYTDNILLIMYTQSILYTVLKNFTLYRISKYGIHYTTVYVLQHKSTHKRLQNERQIAMLFLNETNRETITNIPHLIQACPPIHSPVQVFELEYRTV